MTTFEELLKATLHGVNSNFEGVDQELREVIADASNGVEKVTNGGARLYLEKISENAEGVIYSVFLHIAESKRPTELMGIMVSATGYPIRIASGANFLLSGASLGQLADKNALRSYFAEMAKNPNSPLVVHLAFHFRRKQKTSA